MAAAEQLEFASWEELDDFRAFCRKKGDPLPQFTSLNLLWQRYAAFCAERELVAKTKAEFQRRLAEDFAIMRVAGVYFVVGVTLREATDSGG